MLLRRWVFSVARSRRIMRAFSNNKLNLQDPTVQEAIGEFKKEMKLQADELKEPAPVIDNYEDVMNNFANIAKNSELLTAIMKSLNQEYKELQNGVFTLNTVQNMVQTLSVNQLVELGLASFIGSISSPRNENLSTYFFDLAKHKSETKREELLVEYYTAYVQKMLAAEKGDKEMFDLSNRKILSLVTEENEEHVPGVIYHSLAKEMYKVALNTMGTKNKRSKEGLFRQAASLFEIAAQHGHTPAYYYLAELYESGDMPGGLNFVKATEFYKAAAAGDFPKALFKLSLMYSYAHQGFQRAQHAKESPPAVHLCQESG